MSREQVLLVNLGTPEAPTPAAVRAFLAEFLSDPMVVGGPRWLWLPLLHGVILRRRPARVAALYEKIWTPEGSPLAAGTVGIARALQAALPDVAVRHCYRYGSPNLREHLAAFDDRATAAAWTAGSSPGTSPGSTEMPPSTQQAGKLPAVQERSLQQEERERAGPLPSRSELHVQERSLQQEQRERASARPRIVVVPLFPQRTASSFGTIAAEAQRIAEERGLTHRLTIATIPPDDPDYIAALAEQTHLALGEPVDVVDRTQRAIDEGKKSTEVMGRAMELTHDEFPGLKTEEEMRQSLDEARAVLEWAGHAVERAREAVKEARRLMSGRPDRLLVSFHSIPLSHDKREGSVYRKDCERTFRALLTRLRWPEECAEITFQSRFGPAKWLGPATAERLTALGRQGVRRVAVIAPGFLTEGLETLEELDIRGAETFRAAGGEEFLRIPAVGAHPRLIAALARAAAFPSSS